MGNSSSDRGRVPGGFPYWERRVIRRDRHATIGHGGGCANRTGADLDWRALLWAHRGEGTTYGTTSVCDAPASRCARILGGTPGVDGLHCAAPHTHTHTPHTHSIATQSDPHTRFLPPPRVG